MSAQRVWCLARWTKVVQRTWYLQRNWTCGTNRVSIKSWTPKKQGGQRTHTWMAAGPDPLSFLKRTYSTIEIRKQESINASDGKGNTSDDLVAPQYSVPQLCDIIKQRMSDLNISITETVEKNIHAVIILMLEHQILPSDVLEIISNDVVSIKYPVEKWKSTFELFKSYDFEPGQIKAILMCVDCKVILKSPRQLMDMIQCLQALGLEEGDNQLMISQYPVILDSNPGDIMTRYNELLDLFQKVHLKKLFMFSPQILTDPMQEIIEKYEYVIDTMNLPSKIIPKCQLFSHSLHHIKSRHLFLERAGLFERPNKHGSTLTENPSLKMILDTVDKSFCREVAIGLSVGEYEAFKDMCWQEMLKENEGLGETDIDSDSENGD